VRRLSARQIVRWRVNEHLRPIPIWLLLVFTTTLEVNGDAIVRKATYNHAGAARIGLTFRTSPNLPILTGGAPYYHRRPDYYVLETDNLGLNSAHVTRRTH
jgi:hypothetical protein